MTPIATSPGWPDGCRTLIAALKEHLPSLRCWYWCSNGRRGDRRTLGARPGYDDLRMAEGRHPNRWELDIAAPENPVWLEHRSGHALRPQQPRAGFGRHSREPRPPGGVIERDLETGEPTGVLFEMRSYLRQRLGNTRSPQEFEDGMRDAGQLLSSYGITSVQDAGADNGIERWHSFQQLQSGGALSCRITMFAGVERLDELAAIPSPTGGGPRWGRPAFGSGDYWLRLGHAR